MGYWQIVQADSTTNMVMNPSAETTGNFAARTTATVTRSTTYAAFDIYSYRVQTTADDEGITLTLSALTNAAHYVTMFVRGTLPTTWQWSLDNANWTAPTLISSQYNSWSLYGASFIAAQANGSTTLIVRQSGAGNGDFYLDGIQVEAKSYWTTYCDGTRDGCVWTGTAHASTSTRSSQIRSGGRVRDIYDDYNIGVVTMTGFGMPQVIHNRTDFAVMPGGQLQSIKIPPREFSLVLEPQAGSLSTIHTKRDNIIDLVKPDAVSPVQPVVIRYSGSTNIVEIQAYYLGGMEGNISGEQGIRERFAIRFIAYDPFWYYPIESGTSLTTSQDVTANYIVEKVSGIWQAMGAGADATVRAAIWGPDNCLYIGGDFTTMGVASTSRIAKWDPNTGAWSALGTGAADNSVYCLAFDAVGTLYAGGDFTQMGGIANTKGIAKWNGSAWSALGTGITVGTSVYAMVVGYLSPLYVTGNFTQMGGILSTTYIAKWDGSAWTSIGALNGAGFSLALGLDDSIYVGGTFSTAAGITVNGIAKYDGSAFSAMGDGVDVTTTGIYALAVTPDGILYVGGNYASIDGLSIGLISSWNGSYWSALGGGIDSGVAVWALSVDTSGVLHVGGSFTSVGGLTLADNYALWYGGRWFAPSLNLPGAPAVYTVAENKNNGTLVLGFNTSGTATAAYGIGTNIITNNSSANAYPIIKVKRTGGTGAALQWIQNQTTGKLLLCQYQIQNGETVTLDLRQGKKTVTSDFYGNVIGRTALPGSDIATFCLQSGSNTILFYVSATGGPTITSQVTWHDTFWSVDGAN